MIDPVVSVYLVLIVALMFSLMHKGAVKLVKFLKEKGVANDSQTEEPEASSDEERKL